MDLNKINKLQVQVPGVLEGRAKVISDLRFQNLLGLITATAIIYGSLGPSTAQVFSATVAWIGAICYVLGVGRYYNWYYSKSRIVHSLTHALHASCKHHNEACTLAAQMWLSMCELGASDESIQAFSQVASRLETEAVQIRGSIETYCKLADVPADIAHQYAAKVSSHATNTEDAIKRQQAQVVDTGEEVEATLSLLRELHPQ